MNDEPAVLDYSHETRVSRNPALRALWLTLGLICSGLGLLGYFVPLMPGTVFLLLAAFFFARSSPRFYNWLLNNRLVGPLIRDWRAGLGLSMRAKLLAVGMIVVTLATSSLFVGSIWGKGALALVGLALSAYLLTRATKVVR